jgi:phage N-6-adenine-methyltransferase
MAPVEPFKIVKADIQRLGYIGRSPAQEPRDPDSWFTPPEYLDAVRAVLGGIDLDPFTSADANIAVGATHIFTPEKSAFDHDWRVCDRPRVFMNPPYAAGMIGRAVNRFLNQYDIRRFDEGIVLVNNATDTRWFEALATTCHAICFTDHRISFWSNDGKSASGNTRGQAFFYFGPDVAAFARVFGRHGFIVTPYR